MTTLLKGAKLATAIKDLAASNGKLLKHVHVLAVSACVEAAETDNTNAINRLADAMANVGSRAVIAWLNEFSPASFNIKEKTFKLVREKADAYKAEGEDYGKRLLGGVTYYDKKPDNTDTFRPLDIPALFARMVKKYDKLEEEGLLEEDGNDFEGIELVREFLASKKTGSKKAKKSKVTVADTGEVPFIN